VRNTLNIIIKFINFYLVEYLAHLFGRFMCLFECVFLFSLPYYHLTTRLMSWVYDRFFLM